jgi:hypothetical protein
MMPLMSLLRAKLSGCSLLKEMGQWSGLSWLTRVAINFAIYWPRSSSIWKWDKPETTVQMQEMKAAIACRVKRWKTAFRNRIIEEDRPCGQTCATVRINEVSE